MQTHTHTHTHGLRILFFTPLFDPISHKPVDRSQKSQRKSVRRLWKVLLNKHSECPALVKFQHVLKS